MSALRRTRSDLLDHLAGVQFQHAARSYLHGTEPHEIDTLHWSVTATIADWSEGEEDANWMDRPGVSLSPPAQDEDDAATVDIFRMSGFTIDLTRTDNLFDALDSFTSDSADFAEVADDREPGHLAADLDERLEGFGSTLVVFDRAQLAPAWRGLGGVGRLLTGCGFRWVAVSARCVVAHPYPFEAAERAGAHRDDASDPEIVAGLAQVRHVWSSLGFFPYRDDLYVLDPATTAMDDAVKLLATRLLR